jgi:AcrR family transcriptional regulator
VPLEPLTPERRRAMTRQYLLDAAEIVFAREGFHGATLDEVAAAAGFTKGAVYSNFKNKDDLFLELIDDRIEKQFAVVSEVLEGVPHEAAQQLPRVSELLQGGTFFWDETWSTLWLEFVLYARRNPAAREKLAARLQREREVAQVMMQSEYTARGSTPPFPVEELAKIVLATFNGLSIDVLIDPEFVTRETLDTTLAFFYAAMDVDDSIRPRDAAPRTRSTPRTRRTPPAPPTPPTPPEPPSPPAPPTRPRARSRARTRRDAPPSVDGA